MSSHTRHDQTPEAAGRQWSSRRGRHDVFVSYSTQDKLAADAIVSRLEQAGIRCWIAPRDILPGTVFAEAIVDAIDTSRLMVVVISGGTNQSHHVIREVEHAIDHDVVVIPFRIEAVEPTGALAFYLKAEHWLDAMTPPLESHIAELVETAHAFLDMPATQPSAGNAGKADEHRSQVTPAHVPLPRRGRRRVVGLVAVVAVAVLGLATAAVFLLTRGGQERSGTLQPPRMVALKALVAGDCLQTPADYVPRPLAFWATTAPWPSAMPVVPCDQPHGGEVFYTGDLMSNGAYPGQPTVEKMFNDRCRAAFEAYVGIPYDDSVLSYTGAFPADAASWRRGDHKIGCVAYDPRDGRLNATVKRSFQ